MRLSRIILTYMRFLDTCNRGTGKTQRCLERLRDGDVFITTNFREAELRLRNMKIKAKVFGCDSTTRFAEISDKLRGFRGKKIVIDPSVQMMLLVHAIEFREKWMAELEAIKPVVEPIDPLNTYALSEELHFD